jgi:hypothetical protein
MNRVQSYLGRVTVLSILMFAITICIALHIFSYKVSAQAECDAWVDYFVDENGHGTCTIGIGANDFLNGTGIAKCTFARNGNINCTCKGKHTIPLDSALIFNKTDQCCIFIGDEDPIVSDNTFGLGTPSGIANATCKVKQ